MEKGFICEKSCNFFIENNDDLCLAFALNGVLFSNSNTKNS